MPQDTFKQIAEDMDKLQKNNKLTKLLFFYSLVLILFISLSFLYIRRQEHPTIEPSIEESNNSSQEDKSWMETFEQDSKFSWTIEDANVLTLGSSLDSIIQTYGQPSRWDKTDTYAHLVWDTPNSQLGDYAATVDLTFILDDQGTYRLQYGSFWNFPLPAGQTFSYNPDGQPWQEKKESDFVTLDQGTPDRLTDILATYQPPTSLTLAQIVGESPYINYYYYNDDVTFSAHLIFVEHQSGDWVLEHIHLQP